MPLTVSFRIFLKQVGTSTPAMMLTTVTFDFNHNVDACPTCLMIRRPFLKKEASQVFFWEYSSHVPLENALS